MPCVRVLNVPCRMPPVYSVTVPLTNSTNLTNCIQHVFDIHDTESIILLVSVLVLLILSLCLSFALCYVRQSCACPSGTSRQYNDEDD